MKQANPRKILRNVLMVILVIDFLALVVALTNLIQHNPLRDYRLELGIGFVVIAALARFVCQGCREEKESPEN